MLLLASPDVLVVLCAAVVPAVAVFLTVVESRESLLLPEYLLLLSSLLLLMFVWIPVFPTFLVSLLLLATLFLLSPAADDVPAIAGVLAVAIIPANALVPLLGVILLLPSFLLLRCTKKWCNVSPSSTDVSPTENSWMLHPLDKVSLGYFAPDRTIPSLN
jgi:hypothetical protein